MVTDHEDESGLTISSILYRLYSTTGISESCRLSSTSCQERSSRQARSQWSLIMKTRVGIVLYRLYSTVDTPLDSTP